MNKTINALIKKRDNLKAKQAKELAKIDAKLREAYYKVFKQDKDLNKAIMNAESSDEYGSDENGIYSWFRYYGLYDYPENSREYLADYVQEHGLDIDWDNECFLMYQGEELIIQDDTGRNNGVWFNHNCVIDESEYKDKDTGEVDTVKRNMLIEAWMEDKGYYPGVFRVDRHGNVSFINTKE